MAKGRVTTKAMKIRRDPTTLPEKTSNPRLISRNEDPQIRTSVKRMSHLSKLGFKIKVLFNNFDPITVV